MGEPQIAKESVPLTGSHIVLGEPQEALSLAVEAAMTEGASLGLDGALLASHVASRLHEADWVNQPVIRTDAEFEAVPIGATIRTNRPRGRGFHFFEKTGSQYVELDPGDRTDGETAISHSEILSWCSTGFAVIVGVPDLHPESVSEFAK